MYDVITIGSATKDVYLISANFQKIKSTKFKTGLGECFAYGSKFEIGDIYFDTGGGATNAAFTFANLGLKTSLVSKVGKDIYGMEILQLLADNNINISNLTVDRQHKTAYSTILVEPGGDRTILVYRGASANFTSQDINFNNLKSKWLYVSSIGGNLQLLKKIWDFARKHKIKIVWNPGSAELKFGKNKLIPLIKQVAIFNLNKEEAVKLTGQNDIKKIIKTINKVTQAYIVITDGAKGSYLSDGLMIYYTSALKVKPINTTGAGDAFCSAFCAGFILKNDWDYALRLAVLNSAGVIQQMGAKNGLLKRIPKQKDLNRIKISIL